MQDNLHTISEIKYLSDEDEFKVEILGFDESEEIKNINSKLKKINLQLDNLK